MLVMASCMPKQEDDTSISILDSMVMCLVDCLFPGAPIFAVVFEKDVENDGNDADDETS